LNTRKCDDDDDDDDADDDDDDDDHDHHDDDADDDDDDDDDHEGTLAHWQHFWTVHPTRSAIQMFKYNFQQFFKCSYVQSSWSSPFYSMSTFRRPPIFYIVVWSMSLTHVAWQTTLVFIMSSVS